VKRRINGILAAIALLLVVLVLFGTAYEQVARRRERARFRQVGRSVDIGGRSLNIFCSGEGSPTVIFESDALTPGYSWVYIQREIARTTRACWYDRAGYGWSDPGPAPHTSVANAADLHELLLRGSVKAPFVLAGDRFGSLDVRVFGSRYPEEVAGMVLVDPVLESEERMGMAGRVPFHLGYPPDFVLRVSSGIGLMRLMAHTRPESATPHGLTLDEQATLAGLEHEPKMRAAFLAEQGFMTSLAEVRTAGAVGSHSWPEMVLTGSDRRARADEPESVIRSVREMVRVLRHE